jgi:hypothetical protein
MTVEEMAEVVRHAEAADQLGGPLAEYLAERIPRAARNAHQRFPKVPVDDFTQGLWEAVLRHPGRFGGPWAEGNHRRVWERLRDAAYRIGRSDERYWRAVKAAAEGYATDDEEFYARPVIARVLRALIDANMDVAEAMAKAITGTDSAGVHINTEDPFGGAENYAVMLIDVATAYGKLSAGQRKLLATYYAVEQERGQQGRWERQQLASSMGITELALRKRAERALRALQDHLGGDSPWKS